MKISVANPSYLNDINFIRDEIRKDLTNDHNLSAIDEYEIENNQDRVTFVAIKEEIVVGYINLHRFDQLGNNQDAIFEVFVLPSLQGKQIGTTLIRNAEMHIKANMSFSRLVLGVLNSNNRAYNLYEKLGYENVKSDTKGTYMAKNI